MSSKRPYKIIISGGGTGGHIYPAIAIANELKEMHPDIDILFVGAQGRMEMQKIPEAGFRIIGLPISGIQRSLSLRNLKFPFKLLASLWRSGKILKEFNPDVAVGVGGFASGPLLYMATRKKIPTLIQEQNSYAGLTNKLLAKKVDVICVAYENLEKYFPYQKIILTGNPVREDIERAGSRVDQAVEFFSFSKQQKTILVVGGSLGARNINDSIYAHIQEIIDADIQLVWQTGAIYFDEFQSKMESHPKERIRIFKFLKEMDLAYAMADLVISRAGALAISELCIVRKPVIFVPSANVAEDHQTKNAQALVETDAALTIPDSQAKDRLVKEALELLDQNDKLEKLANNIGKLARPDAGKAIAGEILKLVA
ncbi:MAG: undecaprenyldiphospho-muramoylpentapeptide beta-N-acetylglucosaminyltransferase [Bacteroidetes bacterium]|nr:undecaprenyldiphospho-muramoylpentapeptide beta-N-acetylglucosaminyltransferase [Bacteroidota bacterium]